MFIKKSDGRIARDLRHITATEPKVLRHAREERESDKVNYYGSVYIWKNGRKVKGTMHDQWYRDKGGRVMVYYNL